MKMEWLIAGFVGLLVVLYLVSKSSTANNPLNTGSYAPGVGGEGNAIDGAIQSVGLLNNAISGNSYDGADFGDDDDDSDY